MSALKKIIYNCRHATYLIEKRQHTALTLKERLHLLIHLSGCGICRLFQRQSRMINRLMRGLFHAANTGERKLDDDIKREMQERINERLNK